MPGLFGKYRNKFFIQGRTNSPQHCSSRTSHARKQRLTYLFITSNWSSVQQTTNPHPTTLLLSNQALVAHRADRPEIRRYTVNYTTTTGSPFRRLVAVPIDKATSSTRTRRSPIHHLLTPLLDITTRRSGASERTSTLSQGSVEIPAQPPALARVNGLSATMRPT